MPVIFSQKEVLMYYSISQTVDIMPYVSCIVLLILLLVLEIINRKENLVDKPFTEPGRGGFLPPPGEGYEYYISADTIVYILHKSKRQYRIYLVKGNAPNAAIKHDRYGRYFKVLCDDFAAAERIIEKAFGKSPVNSEES